MSSDTKSIFLSKKNIFFMSITGLFSVIGANNTNLLIVAVVTIIAGMVFSSYEHRFCWSLFLVPNIRLFDGLGFTYMVNILFIIPLFIYILDPKKRKSGIVLVYAFTLFTVEVFHKVFYSNSMIELYGWVLAFIWCVYATLDNTMDINKDDATYALMSGVIFSGTVFLINHPDMTSDLIQKVVAGHRFEAYASDPNAYATYLCLALSALIIKKKFKSIDLVFMIVLFAFGMLTTSKMCMILLAVSMTYFILKMLSNYNNYIKSFVILALIFILGYYFKDTLVQLLENVIDRAGGTGDVSLDSLTSNRYKIQMNYLNILFNDPMTLIFGKGFSYHKHLPAITSQQAHNTYLDIILSWGIVGTVVFLLTLYAWVKKYKQKIHDVNFSFSSKLPVFILMLSFFSLSFFSAGMFFFVVSFCLIQLEPKIYEE